MTQSIFITAANPYGFAVGSAQVVSDAIAVQALADIALKGGWGQLSSVTQVAPQTPTDLARGALTPNQAAQVVALVSGAGNFPPAPNLSPLAETPLMQTASDVLSGSGLLNGSLLDTGQSWVANGDGAATTSINPGGWIEGAGNTYCFVNTGAKITRAVQVYSGPGATMSIGLNSALTDMLHVTFASGGNAALTYWKTGVGTSQFPTTQTTPNLVPNTNDGLPHTLVLDVFGIFVVAYVDGVCVLVGADNYVPSLQGNWMFAQIHAGAIGAEKIYGVSSYSQAAVSSSDRPVKGDFGVVQAAVLNGQHMAFGVSSNPYYAPNSSIYLWHLSGQVCTIASDGTPTLQAYAQRSGYGASIQAKCNIGVVTQMDSGNDGVGRIQHQTTDRITFPFNIGRVDIQQNLKLVNVTAPGDTPSGGGYLYAENGALKWKGSSGTITTLAPA